MRTEGINSEESSGQQIQEILPHFNPVSLDDLDKVSFMNRVDAKFLFPVSSLPALLEAMKENYSILEIDSERCFGYETTYYDDDQYSMYYAHHNGSLNRYKIRYRTYLNMQKSYLEIKFKTNKSRTIKKRKSYTREELQNGAFKKFIGENTPFSPATLHEILTNKFHRLTFVNNNYTERLTIDFGLTFSCTCGNTSMDYLAIVEVKYDRKLSGTGFCSYIKPFGLRKSGFSKYAVGCTCLFRDLKCNRFKKTHLNLNKLHNDCNSIAQ